jgi:hypothetical protein
VDLDSIPFGSGAGMELDSIPLGQPSASMELDQIPMPSAQSSPDDFTYDAPSQPTNDPHTWDQGFNEAASLFAAKAKNTFIDTPMRALHAIQQPYYNALHPMEQAFGINQSYQPPPLPETPDLPPWLRDTVEVGGDLAGQTPYFLGAGGLLKGAGEAIMGGKLADAYPYIEKGMDAAAGFMGGGAAATERGRTLPGAAENAAFGVTGPVANKIAGKLPDPMGLTSRAISAGLFGGTAAGAEALQGHPFDAKNTAVQAGLAFLMHHPEAPAAETKPQEGVISSEEEGQRRQEGLLTQPEDSGASVNGEAPESPAAQEAATPPIEPPTIPGAVDVGPSDVQAEVQVKPENSDTPTEAAPADNADENIVPRKAGESDSGALPTDRFPVYKVPASDIKVDPETFQFKLGANPSGEVHSELQGQDWSDTRAGNLLLWQAKDGTLYVAHGHHRFAHALRTGKEWLNAQILREEDGYSPIDARRIAAEDNIANGKGTAYDHAEFFRFSPGYEDPTAAQSKGISGQGYALGKLAADNLYSHFRDESIDPARAAAIAEGAPNNEKVQDKVISYLQGNPHATPQQLRIRAQAELHYGDRFKDETQEDLLGYQLGESPLDRIQAAVDRKIREFDDQMRVGRAGQRIEKNADAQEAVGVTAKTMGSETSSRIKALQQKKFMWQHFNAPGNEAIRAEAEQLAGIGTEPGSFAGELPLEAGRTTDSHSDIFGANLDEPPTSSQPGPAEPAPKKAQAEPVVPKPERPAGEDTATAVSGDGQGDQAGAGRSGGGVAEGPDGELAPLKTTMRASDPVKMAGEAEPEMEAPERKETPELAKLTDALKELKGVKPELAKAASIGEKFSDAKESVGKAADGLKGAAHLLKKTLAGRPVFDDAQKALGWRHGALTESGLNAREFVRKAQKAVPKLQDREAISNWLDTGGDEKKLDTAIGETSRRYRAGYERAKNLPPDLVESAKHMRSYFEHRLAEAQDAGILEDGLEDYIHRMYPKDGPWKRGAIAELQGGILAGKPALAKKRVFSYDYEAERAGYKPEKDFSKRIAAYDMSLNKAIADRVLVKNLMKWKMPDGKPAIDAAGYGVDVEGKSGDPGVLLVKPHFKADTDYIHYDHPALRKWKWVFTDPVSGKTTLMQGDVLVHKDALKRINAVFGKSAVRQNALGRGAMALSREVKQTMLSVSLFHQAQITIHAAEHRVFKPAEKIDMNDPTQRALVEHELQVYDYRGHELFEEGLSGSGVLGRIPKIGRRLHAYNEYLFQDLIPRYKMGMATHALERNRARYPELSEDELLHLSARQANSAFGELNYEMMGRSKTLQDVLRIGLLAPDFLEARMRFKKQAATKYGGEQRTALLMGAATMYIAARILNKIFDNNYHFNSMDHLVSVEYKGRLYGLRTIQGDLLHLITNPMNFAYHRLNPVYGRTLIEALTGRNEFGNKRTAVQQVEDFVKQVIPISLRGWVTPKEQTIFESILNAIGIQERRTKATIEAERKQHAKETAKTRASAKAGFL